MWLGVGPIQAVGSYCQVPLSMPIELDLLSETGEPVERATILSKVTGFPNRIAWEACQQYFDR
jgi:hypothetical protein